MPSILKKGRPSSHPALFPSSSVVGTTMGNDFSTSKERAKFPKTHDLLESQYLQLSPGQLYAFLTLESHLGRKGPSSFLPRGSESDASRRPRPSPIRSADPFTHIFQELGANERAVTHTDKIPTLMGLVWIPGEQGTINDKEANYVLYYIMISVIKKN